MRVVKHNHHSTDMTPQPSPQLHQEVQALRDENGKLREEIERLKQHNHVLRLKVDAMARKLFGRSSEKLDSAQLQLVFDAIDQEVAQQAKKLASADASEDGSAAEDQSEQEGKSPSQARKKRSLEELVEGLPVTQVIIDPDEVKADPESWECMGAESKKLVDYTPGKFSCQEVIRRKWVRKDSRHVPPIIAPLNQLQDRCIATPRLLAHTATQHFELHLPYYRIEKEYERQGLVISRQTLCGWMGMAAEACRLLHASIKEQVFADGYVQIDETPVKYQDPEREGKCGIGYFWVVHNPISNLTYFEWHAGRGAVCLEALVPKGWRGVIGCDGFGVYDTFVRSEARAGMIKLSGCLTHARRKFFEARDEGADAQWVLKQMQQLYQIESRLRQASAGPEEKVRVRQEQSKPIMERIKSRIDELVASRKHLPRNSLTGQALSYAQNQWTKLCTFLGDGRVEIDNNLVENAIRPSAIGKKNWLFIGDVKAGERSAVFYTLIANCQRESLNASEYLTELFERLPTATNQNVHELTPKAWAAKKREAKKAQATTLATLTVAGV